MKTVFAMCLCTAIVVVAPSASAQVLTSRSSTLNFNYVFGAGADGHIGGDLRERHTLLLADTDTTSFMDSTAGVLPGGTPYSAGASCELLYQYALTGTLLELQSITASASTTVSATASGAGSAVMQALNPGNQTVFGFTVRATCAYHLTGSILLQGPNPFDYVALEHFNGFNWEYVFYSAFLPGGQGEFDQAGVLAQGEYRISGVISISAGANQSGFASYDYTLDLPDRAGCTADFNGDGILNSGDFFDFLTAFFTLSPTADFNADSTVNSQDFFDFLAVFFAGC